MRWRFCELAFSRTSAQKKLTYIRPALIDVLKTLNYFLFKIDWASSAKGVVSSGGVSAGASSDGGLNAGASSDGASMSGV